MKLSLYIFLATLSLLGPSFADRSDNNLNLRPGLSARNDEYFRNVPSRPNPYGSNFEEGLSRPVPVKSSNTGTIIQRLPKIAWKVVKVGGLSAWRYSSFTVRNRGRPWGMYRTDEWGDPHSVEVEEENLWKDLWKLKKEPGTGGTVWYLIGKDPDRSDPMELRYKIYYFSSARAIKKLWAEQAEDSSYPPSREFDKRSSEVQILDSSATTESKDPAAIFQQYLETLYTVQANIGALIAPFLNNITSQTNITIVHQMAQSIYYDLTGSTTTLIGPFNDGLIYLSNITNATATTMTSANQVAYKLTTGGTVSNMTDLYLGLASIYTSLWVKAVTIANSTGLLAQQAYLASCLVTNDTSVYPPGFTDIQKNG